VQTGVFFLPPVWAHNLYLCVIFARLPYYSNVSYLIHFFLVGSGGIFRSNLGSRAGVARLLHGELSGQGLRLPARGQPTNCPFLAAAEAAKPQSRSGTSWSQEIRLFAHSGPLSVIVNK